MSKLRLLELFGGIGACSKALEKLGVDFEIVDYVEIDKYAVKSFNAIHNTNFEPQDITTWNKDIEVDLIMHGSPCQDFSLAGLQAGGDEGSGTRSSLMYETIRIVKKLRPKYVIWENVKNLLSKKHRHNFDSYLEMMEKLGYANYYQVLNAKDYGIPQNRERVFTVSILGNENYKFPKENIQECEVINPLQGISGKSWQFEQNVYSENSILRSLKAGGGSGNIPKVIENFEFPPKQELKLRLKDMLEDNVDEKYYLSDKMIKYISATGTANFKNPDCKINLDIARPLTTDQNKRAGTTNYLSNDLPDNYDLNEVNKVGHIPQWHQRGGIYDENGLVPTICATDYKTPKLTTIKIKNNTKQGYLEAQPGDGVYTNTSTKRGTVQKEMIQTLTTFQDKGVVMNDLKIRKLTPKECWRLMGFDDEDYEKASQVNSNAQLYKQAGNSIVVNVLIAIIKKLLRGEQ